MDPFVQAAIILAVLAVASAMIGYIVVAKILRPKGMSKKIGIIVGKAITMLFFIIASGIYLYLSYDEIIAGLQQ